MREGVAPLPRPPSAFSEERVRSPERRLRTRRGRVRDARPEGRDRGAATDLSETQGDTRRRGHGRVAHRSTVRYAARSPTRRSRGTPTPAVRPSTPSVVLRRQTTREGRNESLVARGRGR
jgi:hypothetical protein